MYLSARKFASEVGLPYCFILKLCNEKKLPHLKCGTKKMIQVEDGKRTLQFLASEPVEAKQRELPSRHFDFRAALRAEKEACRLER